MNESTEIQKTESTELASFGGRDPIKEIALRLKTMMPNAQKFTDNEAQAVAQVAFSHDLDPFNGEVWGIKGGGGEWYGVMVGIKGIRRGAKREADKTKSVYWLEVPRIVDAKKYGCDKPGAVAYEIVLRDTLTVQAWTKSVGDLVRAGAAYKEAVEMMGGQMPCTVGVGIADPSERSKMSIHARAKKRAEAEALKIRYSLEFRGAQISVEDDAENTPAYTGDFVDGEVAQPAQIEQPRPSENELLKSLGFDSDEPAPIKTAVPEPQPEPQQQDNIEARAKHAELWKAASKAGIINAASAKAWSIRREDQDEDVLAKIGLIIAALGIED